MYPIKQLRCSLHDATDRGQGAGRSGGGVANGAGGGSQDDLLPDLKRSSPLLMYVLCVYVCVVCLDESVSPFPHSAVGKQSPCLVTV